MASGAQYSSLNGQTPDQAYFGGLALAEAA